MTRDQDVTRSSDSLPSLPSLQITPHPLLRCQMTPLHRHLQTSNNGPPGIPNPPQVPSQLGHRNPIPIPSALPHSKSFGLPQTSSGAYHRTKTHAFSTANNTSYTHRSHVPLHTPDLPTGTTVSTLLPYCTTEPPLNTAQVISLSDVVGSLRELVLLALSAMSGDAESMGRLERALGRQKALGVVEFFEEEWEVEG